MQLVELTSENIQTYLNDCISLQAQLVSNTEGIQAEHFVATATNAHSYFVSVVEEGDLIAIGVLSLLVHPGAVTGYINNIVVDERHRGKGLFKVVMDALEEKAVQWGCTDLALTCSRPEVQGLYEKRGYRNKETKYYRKEL